METSKILSREELGDMYYKLKEDSGLSSDGMCLFYKTKDAKTEEADKLKLEAIAKELGGDFLLVCRLKKEKAELEKRLERSNDNISQLINRVSRLEKCITELKKNKWDRWFVWDFEYQACNTSPPTSTRLPFWKRSFFGSDE